MAASRGPIRVEGDARLDFARDGERYNMKFLDADVLDECDCRRGKHHCVRTAGIVRREHEHWPKDSVGQEERRVCGAIGCTSGFLWKKSCTTLEDQNQERCVTRIEEVDDIEHEKSEEQRKQEEAGGRGRAWCKEGCAKTRSPTTKRTGKN